MQNRARNHSRKSAMSSPWNHTHTKYTDVANEAFFRRGSYRSRAFYYLVTSYAERAATPKFLRFFTCAFACLLRWWTASAQRTMNNLFYAVLLSAIVKSAVTVNHGLSTVFSVCKIEKSREIQFFARKLFYFAQLPENMILHSTRRKKLRLLLSRTAFWTLQNIS